MRKLILLTLASFLLFSITGCWMNSSDGTENRAPYAVIGPSSSVDYEEDSNPQMQIFHLQIDEQNGLKDPDGDIVYFKSSSLPSWISLDEDTGLVTVDTTDSHGAEDFLFWSEDEHGADTSESPYTITISVTFS